MRGHLLISSGQDRDNWPAVVNTATNFGAPKCREGLCSNELHRPLVQSHDWSMQCLYVRVDIVFGLSVFVLVGLFQILLTVLFLCLTLFKFYFIVSDFVCCTQLYRDRGGTVVKVPCYKSEGRWFDPSWCHWNFSLT